MPLTIAALASGTGSNISAILDAIEGGKLDATVALVLSNKPTAPVIERVTARGIPTWARSHKDFPDRESFDAALIEAITALGADTIVLAGYMRILSASFIRAFSGRILNIHPAILPSFPGAHGGSDALAYGVRFTGATVHFVNEIMDNGPVIIQGIVPVGCGETEETLMPRIHTLEHRMYPQALQWLAEDRLRVNGRKVSLLPPAEKALPLATTGGTADAPWLISPALEGF